jgi:hypothetical protein
MFDLPLHKRKHVRLRDGTIRELRDDEIIPDGASVVVPMAMRDQAITDDEDDIPIYDADDMAAEQAWQDMKVRLSDAYKTPAPQRAAKAQSQQTYDADPDAAWQKMVADMSNAWRGGGR